jgi:hypothetical protein
MARDPRHTLSASRGLILKHRVCIGHILGRYDDVQQHENWLLAALVLATYRANSAAVAGDRDDDLSASAAQVEREWLQGQHRLFQNHIGDGGAVLITSDRRTGPSHEGAANVKPNGDTPCSTKRSLSQPLSS